MQVDSVNSTQNQNFRALKITTGAGKRIRAKAMQPTNKETMTKFVNNLAKAKESLSAQKWGDVIVSNTDKGLQFLTALITPVLVGDCIELFNIHSTDLDKDGNIAKQTLGKRHDKSDDIEMEEWNTLDDAVNVALQHENLAIKEKENAITQQIANATYSAGMDKALKELGI